MDAANHRRTEYWGANRMQLPDVRTDLLTIEDMDCTVATGYGRLVVPFAQYRVRQLARLIHVNAGLRRMVCYLCCP